MAILVVLLTVGGFQVSFASDWYYAGASKQGDTWFIDNSSVVKTSERAIVWVRVREKDGIVSKYEIEFVRYPRTYHFRRVILYDRAGNLIETCNFDDNDYSSIGPDTMGEAVHELIW